ncbi:unnamed protein product [Symbiodinium sp. CCMP2592]|nr:unnamed protein product [Symbiodinium sp. CCMP2592]
MSPELFQELLIAAVLLPFARIDLRSPAAPCLIASDASTQARASVVCSLPELASEEFLRHTLHKGVWSRLLRPLPAYLRARGQLPCDQELPDEQYSSHPIWDEVCASFQFGVLTGAKRNQGSRHINVLELQVALEAESRVGRSPFELLLVSARIGLLKPVQVGLNASTVCLRACLLTGSAPPSSPTCPSLLLMQWLICGLASLGEPIAAELAVLCREPLASLLRQLRWTFSRVVLLRRWVCRPWTLLPSLLLLEPLQQWPIPPAPAWHLVLGLLPSLALTRFASLQSALASGPGGIELLSGSRDLGRALVRLGFLWVLCFDVAHSPAEDLLCRDVQGSVEELISHRCSRVLAAGVPSLSLQLVSRHVLFGLRSASARSDAPGRPDDVQLVELPLLRFGSEITELMSCPQLFVETLRLYAQPVLKATLALAIIHGWYRFAAVPALCFYGICRVGETLSACRAEFLTPDDLLSDRRCVYLQIKKPKTRNRGASVQHVSVLEPIAIALIEFALEPLPRSAQLFAGSPGSYRRRWDRGFAVGYAFATPGFYLSSFRLSLLSALFVPDGTDSAAAAFVTTLCHGWSEEKGPKTRLLTITEDRSGVPNTQLSAPQRKTVKPTPWSAAVVFRTFAAGEGSGLTVKKLSDSTDNLLTRDTATLQGQLPKKVLEDLELAKVFHKVQELVRLVDDLQCTNDLSLQVQSSKRDAVRLAYRDFTEALEALSVSVLGQGARPLATTRSWVPLLRRWRYYVCSLFSWGLLTEQAVAEAADVLKVLDVVGILDPLAGSGWHALLWQEVGGLSVLAMDSYAVRPVAWAPVAVVEDSRTAIRRLQPPDISRWALFLSWPPHSPDTVGSDLLEKFEGTYFLYLGEEEDPNAGDAGLTGGHQLLSRIEKACWGGFTYDDCCGDKFGPAGNLECWNATFIPERCCVRQRIEQVRTTCQCCNLSKTRPVLGSVSEVVEKHGYPVFFDAMTTKAAWFRSGYRGWEPLTFRIFQRFATGQIVLDVGAWVGATAIWEANVAEHVFAVEPTPVSGCQLLANLNVNPPRVSRRVTLIRGALHNETGSVVILNRKEDSNNRIYAGPARPLMTSVPSFTIEALLLKYPRLRRVSFIKIDTEGHERVLIPAMRSFLKKQKPVVLVSLHPIYIGDRLVRRVVNALKEIFPYLYDSDMKTPFNIRRFTFFGSPEDHYGTELLGTWHPL